MLDSNARNQYNNMRTANELGNMISYKQASACRKGDHILIKGFPCKIIDMKHIKNGKHGVAKCKFTGTGIFDNINRIFQESAHSDIEVPEISRKDYCLLGLEEEYMSLLDETTGCIRRDLRIPDDKMENVKKGLLEDEVNYLVTVMGAMGEEKIVDIKKDHN
eukprot:m.355583 g.355583  ORF g.355583 m.355583 type:complete len:162 (-) comp80218_c0_seq1:164-649(-)